MIKIFKDVKYFLLFRKKWKKYFNSESEKSYWEICHYSNSKTVRLHYVPCDDYTEDDVNINLTYEEFEDLIKFLNRIK